MSEVNIRPGRRQRVNLMEVNISYDDGKQKGVSKKIDREHFRFGSV